MMTPPPPDRSRDRRIEDPTNLWIVHPAARALLPWFVARGISANAVSIGGLVAGTLAAAAFARWQDWRFVAAGFALAVAWLIADGLDGMIARATGSASAIGRVLDGVCDHGVFILIYLALATSIGTAEGWALAFAAGAAHALQSSLYEGERARFHRRVGGVPAAVEQPGSGIVAQGYDRLAGSVARMTAAIDAALARAPDAQALGRDYGVRAARPLRFMSLLSANVRVGAITIACLAGDPKLFWWFELLALSAVLVAGLAWHRAATMRLLNPLQHSSVRRT